MFEHRCFKFVHQGQNLFKVLTPLCRIHGLNYTCRGLGYLAHCDCSLDCGCHSINPNTHSQEINGLVLLANRIPMCILVTSVLPFWMALSAFSPLLHFLACLLSSFAARLQVKEVFLHIGHGSTTFLRRRQPRAATWICWEGSLSALWVPTCGSRASRFAWCSIIYLNIYSLFFQFSFILRNTFISTTSLFSWITFLGFIPKSGIIESNIMDIFINFDMVMVLRQRIFINLQCYQPY